MNVLLLHDLHLSVGLMGTFATFTKEKTSMSATKRWLEELSVRMGYEGMINDEVLRRAQEVIHPLYEESLAEDKDEKS